MLYRLAMGKVVKRRGQPNLVNAAQFVQTHIFEAPAEPVNDRDNLLLFIDIQASIFKAAQTFSEHISISTPVPALNSVMFRITDRSNGETTMLHVPRISCYKSEDLARYAEDAIRLMVSFMRIRRKG